MNMHVQPGSGGAPKRETDRTTKIIKLAILAVGGQGGGVVTSWIVNLAESCGYHAQSTSVPGVAQRTGATIYYLELVPKTERTPILALMPSVGDVDIVLAAELMEAGRAIQRGFVSPRTTLISSSHRSLAVMEKAAPGTGILDSEPILEAAHKSAGRVIVADLEKLAVTNRSVISASLFGALAGAKVLPFPRSAYEETIRKSGKGVAASLKAFAAGYDAVGHEPDKLAAPSPVSVTEVKGPTKLVDAYAALEARLERFPPAAHGMLRRGLEKVVDFQDIRYGAEYLDRLEALSAKPNASGAEFVEVAGKYIANAMAYDDVIRVADLKTRASRMDRVKAEVGVKDDQLMTVTEYMHPRGAEICSIMPAPVGAFIERRPTLFKLLDRVVNRGRRVRTDRLRGFLPLFIVSSLRPIRRTLLRHRMERQHMEAWLATVHRILDKDRELALEVLRCRRLIKGYSDTHARGLSKFDKVLSALPLLERRQDGADWLRRLKEAALADEEGNTLDGALKTVASLDTPVAPVKSPLAAA